MTPRDPYHIGETPIGTWVCVTLDTSGKARRVHEVASYAHAVCWLDGVRLDAVRQRRNANHVTTT